MNNNVEKEPRCALNYGDLKDILDNSMLNDKIVNAVQKMLKTQFTKKNGLQDLLLGQRFNFEVYRNILFAQVLHDVSMHWITIST